MRFPDNPKTPKFTTCESFDHVNRFGLANDVQFTTTNLNFSLCKYAPKLSHTYQLQAVNDRGE